MVFASFPREAGLPGNLPVERVGAFTLAAGDWPWFLPFSFSRIFVPAASAAHFYVAFSMVNGCFKTANLNLLIGLMQVLRRSEDKRVPEEASSGKHVFLCGLSSKETRIQE
jgi:hypothetical protein